MCVEPFNDARECMFKGSFLIQPMEILTIVKILSDYLKPANKILLDSKIFYLHQLINKNNLNDLTSSIQEETLIDIDDKRI